KTAPMWEMNAKPLTGTWGFARDSGFTSAMDMNGDGRMELLSGSTFLGYDGSPYTPHSVPRGSISVDGHAINHPGPGYGDPYYCTAVCDWDHDGIADLLWGTQQGNLYLHRGL